MTSSVPGADGIGLDEIHGVDHPTLFHTRLIEADLE